MSGTIAITGAAGFIGSNVVAALNRQGVDDLLLVDTLGCDSKWENLRGLSFDDIVSPTEFLERTHENAGGDNIDAVIHLGACSSTTETDADYLLNNNYRYTRQLCQWAIGHDVRFIYASSAATYGDGSLGYRDDETVLSDLRPLNMYGYSKHLFDTCALRAGWLDRIVGLKLFNVYGPRESHKGDMRSVVHKAYGQVLDAGKIRLFRSYRTDIPDGGQSRDFVYVGDVVDVICHFLTHPHTCGLFNCGTGTSRTWLDLAHAVFAAMGREPHVEFMDMPEALQSRYQYWTQADVAKLRAAGYTHDFTTLEDGVAAYVRWLEAVAHA